MTTTNTAQVMQDYIEEARNAQADMSAAIRDAKERFDAEAKEIRANAMYSAAGRQLAMNSEREALESEISRKAASLREKYDRANHAARQLAREVVVTASHPAPSDAEVAYFSRELNDLKTRLMLESSYQTAVRLVGDFESKYKDGYYAAAMLAEMPTLVQSVMGLAENKDEARVSLKRMHGRLTESAKTDEQRAAEQLLAQEPGAFIEQGADRTRLTELFGSAATYRLTQ